jgi:electron transport complex protein RnfC
MMGFAQYDIVIPSTKGTSGILCLNAKDAGFESPSNCIKCTRCVQNCPMNLMPLYIAGFSELADYDRADEYNAMDCIECGSCAFVCPARRPLVASIRIGKREITNKRRAQQAAAQAAAK